jgi:DNA-binding beta-propeller fold protein YncE
VRTLSGGLAKDCESRNRNCCACFYPIEHVMEVGSEKAHRIEVTADGAKLYTENTFSSVIGLRARERIKKIPTPNGPAGVGRSPDGKTIVLADHRSGHRHRRSYPTGVTRACTHTRADVGRSAFGSKPDIL